LNDFINEHEINHTRKLHTCFGCQEPIPIGSHAKYQSGMFENNFFDGHFCNQCEKIQDECPYFHEMAAEGYCEGDILTNCRQCNQAKDCKIRHKGVDV